MSTAAPAPQEERTEPSSRRWAALVVIAVAQLMVALDATIVSIALPSAQAALKASDAERQLVITAYTLSFGGLLLLGGRIADCLGRKRAFLAGLAGFTLASAVGGAAPSFGVLVAARALQGSFAAILAPTALSLLAVGFTEPHDRAKAFAVFGAVAGSGGAIGMLLGGALTEYLSWRWCLYVNVGIALVAALGGWLVLRDSGPATRPRLDVLGVALGGSGLVLLVYACTLAVSQSWGSSTVRILLAASAALLAVFVLWETRAASPLLPLRVVLDRNRGGAYATVTFGIAGMFGAFLILTYYLQVVLHYTPLQAGLAFLPITIASQAGSWGIASRLMPRVPPRALMAPGALVAGAGMALLSQLSPDGGYLTSVLPAEVLLGLGTACVMVPAFSTATLGVERAEAGAAAAVVNTAQQIGGSVGTSLLNTIAAGATVAYLAAHAQVHPGAPALVSGYATAALWATGILVCAAASALLINAGPPRIHRA